MKSQLVVSALLVVAIVLSLALPWYPAVTNQAVTQTFTYTYDIPTTSTRLQSIYTLPSPISLEGLHASTSSGPSNFIQDLANVSLDTGSLVHVNFVGCQFCLISIAQVFRKQDSCLQCFGKFDRRLRRNRVRDAHHLSREHWCVHGPGVFGCNYCRRTTGWG